MLTCYTMDYWFPSLLSKERPRLMRPLSVTVQTHTSHSRGKHSETQIIGQTAIRLHFFLLKPCCYETLLGPEKKMHDQEGTQLCSQVMEEGGMGSLGCWSLRLELLPDFFPGSLRCKMRSEVINITTAIIPFSLLLHAKTFTSLLAILKATWQHLE